ncbi:hypothetical protein ACO0SA_001365 [Hanseniaspora valbyensis]
MAKKQSRKGNLKSLLKQHNQENQKKLKELKIKENLVNLQKFKKDKITGNKKNISTQQQHNLLTVPFENPDDILFLVGEGDFSYVRSLIESNYHHKPQNIIATSYDNSLKELNLKYPTTFKENYEFLIEKGVKIMLGVDATNLVKSLKISKRTGVNKILNVERLDCIIFNFPHTGAGVKDVDRNIQQHQKLLLNFFKSANELLGLFNAYNANKCTDSYAQSYKTVTNNNKAKGNNCRLAVSLFKGLPYDNWQLKKIANTNDWKTLTTFKFEWEKFQGYQHRRTNSEMSTTKKFDEREARVHLFDKVGVLQKRKTQKNDDEDSENEN